MIKTTHGNNATCFAIPEKTCHTAVISYCFILKTCKKLGLHASSRVPNASMKHSPTFFDILRQTLGTFELLFNEFLEKAGEDEKSILSTWVKPVRGRLPYERDRDACRPLRGVNFAFWSQLGCPGQNAFIFSRKGLF